MEVEDFDWVIIKSMLEEPSSVLLGRGVGLGHLFTEPFIPDIWRYYMGGSIISPKSGLTYFLVNGGIADVFLMVVLASKLSPSFQYSLSPRPDRQLIAFVQQAQRAVIPLVIMFMLRTYIWDVMLFVAIACKLGVTTWYSSVSNRQSKTSLLACNLGISPCASYVQREAV
jgi:hypothetical protein